MAMTILNEQYPPRKPLLTIEADSLDELPTNDVAEGSTATVSGTEYVYENNSGWIEPGSGGGGGGGLMNVTATFDESTAHFAFNKTRQEINDAFVSGKTVLVSYEDPRTDFGKTGVTAVAECSHETGTETGNVYVVSLGGAAAETNEANGYPVAEYI